MVMMEAPIAFIALRNTNFEIGPNFWDIFAIHNAFLPKIQDESVSSATEMKHQDN
jgi:hypothetical protein